MFNAQLLYYLLNTVFDRLIHQETRKWLENINKTWRQHRNMLDTRKTFRQLRVAGSKKQIWCGNKIIRICIGEAFEHCFPQIPVQAWWPWPYLSALVLLHSFVRSRHISNNFCYSLLTILVLAMSPLTAPHLSYYKRLLEFIMALLKNLVLPVELLINAK